MKPYSRLASLELYLASLKPIKPIKVIVDPERKAAILRRYSNGKPMLINIGVKDFS